MYDSDGVLRQNVFYIVAIKEWKMRYLIIIVFFMPNIVVAAHNCIGRVQRVDIAGTGHLKVNIAGVGDGNTLCALNTKLGEYEPEACKAVLSVLLAAKMSGTPVRIYFRNDTNTACDKGNWQDLSTPAHGFYFLRLE